LYQNRNAEAITQFQSIYKNLRDKEIESVTLLRLNHYEKVGEYNLALSQYQSILEHHNDGIYSDEALFFSAEIYNNKLKNPIKQSPSTENYFLIMKTVFILLKLGRSSDF
jgi:tetratricopeptide (TPR) repeat protein